MSNYHFEDDGKEFGATIDISKLQEELHMEEQRPTHKPPQHSGRPPMKPILLLAIIIGLVVFLAVLIITVVLNRTPKENVTDPKNDTPVTEAVPSAEKTGVLAKIDDKNLTIYLLEEKTTVRHSLDAGTAVTDISGAPINIASLELGTVLTYTLDDVTGNVASLSPAKDSWKLDKVTNLTFDAGKKEQSITVSNKLYSCSGDTLVFWKDKLLTLADLDKVDTLTLYGTADNVHAIQVTAYHGTFSFENGKNITGISLTVDNGEPVLLDTVEKVAVSPGGHELKLTGEGIQDYSVNIYVGEGEDFHFDLASLQGKTALVVLSVNIPDYTVYVDGEARPAGENILVLSAGEHTIKLTKDNYLDWEKTVILEEGAFRLEAVMEKTSQYSEVTIRTKPTDAAVYIDGEYIGIAPVLRSLPYGAYMVTLEREGYETVTVPIAVSKPQELIHANLKEAE